MGPIIPSTMSPRQVGAVTELLKAAHPSWRDAMWADIILALGGANAGPWPDEVVYDAAVAVAEAVGVEPDDPTKMD